MISEPCHDKILEQLERTFFWNFGTDITVCNLQFLLYQYNYVCLYMMQQALLIIVQMASLKLYNFQKSISACYLLTNDSLHNKMFASNIRK